MPTTPILLNTIVKRVETDSNAAVKSSIYYMPQLHSFILYTDLQSILRLIYFYNRRITHLQLTPNYLIRHPIPNFLTYQPIQRPCAKSRVVTALRKPFANRVIDRERDAAVV